MRQLLACNYSTPNMKDADLVKICVFLMLTSSLGDVPGPQTEKAHGIITQKHNCSMGLARILILNILLLFGLSHPFLPAYVSAHVVQLLVCATVRKQLFVVAG